MKTWFVSAAVIALAACNQGGASTATNTLAANAAAPPSPNEARGATGPGLAPPPAASAAASMDNPTLPGFYRLQDVEGNFDGGIAVICYAHGQGTELLGERISYTSDPYPCAPQVRRLTPDGWVVTQECNVNQGHTRYTTTARSEANGDYTVRIVPVLDNGQQPPDDPIRSQRVRRIGDCPQGWRPGDWLSLSGGRGEDGVWRAHNVLNPSDVGPTFEELPAYLTALMSH